MPVIPNYCTNCKTHYSSGIFLDNVRNVTLKNNTSQCPKCGKSNKSLEGNFDIIRDTIKILNSSEFTLEQLFKFKDLFEKISSKTLSKNEITETLKLETPELNSLADILPQTRNELYAFITIIISILIFLINNSNNKENSTTVNIINNIQNDIQIQNNNIKIKNDGSFIIDNGMKFPYNLCECCSGKKTKFCDSKKN
jgi:hypothetical protein